MRMKDYELRVYSAGVDVHPDRRIGDLKGEAWDDGGPVIPRSLADQVEEGAPGAARGRSTYGGPRSHWSTGDICDRLAWLVCGTSEVADDDGGIPRPPDEAHIRVSVAGARWKSRRTSAGLGAREHRDNAAVCKVVR